MLTFHFFKIYYLDQVLNDLSKKFTINKRANNFVINTPLKVQPSITLFEQQGLLIKPWGKGRQMASTLETLRKRDVGTDHDIT